MGYMRILPRGTLIYGRPVLTAFYQASSCVLTEISELFKRSKEQVKVKIQYKKVKLTDKKSFSTKIAKLLKNN